MEFINLCKSSMIALYIIKLLFLLLNLPFSFYLYSIIAETDYLSLLILDIILFYFFFIFFQIHFINGENIGR